MTSRWNEIAQDNLTAAQRLADDAAERRADDYARSCVSRSYYAAFSAATFALRAVAPLPFDKGRETPPHFRVPALIKQYLTNNLNKALHRDLRAKMVSLRNERVIADYKSGWTVDRSSAIRALRDARAVCRVLGVAS